MAKKLVARRERIAKRRAQQDKAREEQRLEAERKQREDKEEAERKRQKEIEEAEKRQAAVIAKRQEEAERKNRAAKEEALYEEWLQSFVTVGLLTGVDKQSHDVRVSMTLWSMLDRDQKATFVVAMVQYFEGLTTHGYVDVYPNLDDTKLAQYGVWGGLKIYH